MNSKDNHPFYFKEPLFLFPRLKNATGSKKMSRSWRNKFFNKVCRKKLRWSKRENRLDRKTSEMDDQVNPCTLATFLR